MPQLATHPARCLVIAVGLTLAAWLVVVGFMSYEPSAGGIDIAAGSVTFRDRCGACHIVERGITTHHGPNLYDFGKRAGSRKPNLSAAEYVLESIVDPDAFVHPDNHRGMPKSLAQSMTADEMRNLIAYVLSQGSTPRYEEINALPIADHSGDQPPRVVQRADMELAASVFQGRGECLQCHSLFRNAEYTVIAPGLFGVGLTDMASIRESIVEPDKTVAPYHRWVNVFMSNGQVETGKLMSRSADQLTLMTRTSDGRLEPRQLAIRDIEEEDGGPLIIESSTSPMPAGIDKLLTKEELDALILMIRQLN